VDTFNNFCLGHFNFVHAEDIFLRLPCDDKSFEAQRDVQNPFYDASDPSVPNTNWTVGPMGYVIQVVTILADVMSSIFRSSQRPSSTKSNAAFNVFHARATQRLTEWRASLPTIYQCSVENLGRAIDGGELWTYITLHTVYHTAAMKVNRYIQKSTLGPLEIEAHTNIAKQHAECVLVMMEDLTRNPNQRNSAMGRLSSPFSGYAIISAVDIFTSKFKLENVPTVLASVAGAQAIVTELAMYWYGAKGQQAILQKRVFDLTELTNRRGGLGFVRNRDVEGELEMREPLEKMFERSYDCFYA